MVGGQLLLVVGHHPALALRAGDDPLDGLLQLGHVDGGLVAPRREQGGLIDQVGQVGTGEPWGGAGQVLGDDALSQRLALGVHVEDLFPAQDVGPVDDDLAVEAPGPEQGRVEDVGPVGGGDHDHTRLGVEAIQLDQQLVQGLLPLVVAAAQSGAAVAADGVDLVDEDDRRSLSLGLLEQVADPAGTDPDEHLDELGAGDGVEGDSTFQLPPFR